MVAVKEQLGRFRLGVSAAALKTESLGARQAANATANAILPDTLSHGSAHLFGLHSLMGVANATLGVVCVGIGAYFNTKIQEEKAEYKKNLLAAKYENEVAAQLAIPVKSVNASALEKAAQRNPVLAEELKRIEAKKALDCRTWMVCGALALVATFALAAPLAGLFAGTFAFSSVLSGFLGSEIVAGIVASLVTMRVSEPFVKGIGEKLMGISKTTAQGVIKSIDKARGHGQAISKTQVMEAFVAANPALATEIKNATGKDYEALIKAGDSATLQAVVRQYDERLELSSLAEGINKGTILPTELAWRTIGQKSGVPERGPNDTRIARAGRAIENVMAKGGHVARVVQERAGRMMGRPRPSAAPPVSDVSATPVQSSFAGRLDLANQAAMLDAVKGGAR